MILEHIRSIKKNEKMLLLFWRDLTVWTIKSEAWYGNALKLMYHTHQRGGVLCKLRRDIERILRI